LPDRESVVFVSEPLLTTDFVQYGILAPLLSRLASDFDVTLAAPAVSPEVRLQLESSGIRALSANAHFPMVRHPRDEVPSYITSWARDSFLGLNHRDLRGLVGSLPGIHVNMSMTTAIESDLWYLQGRPLDTSLEVLGPSFPPLLRVAAELGKGPVGLVDHKHFQRCADLSRRIYTNSRFNARWFRERGVPASGVISQFYSSSCFQPTTNRPTRDYILAYLGKETDTTALKLVMGLGYPMKCFGSKSSGWVESTLRGSASARVEFLGRVTEQELAGLYSNALFTAFPFTEEPFGLVPVESMACGTPVLTYRWQGPGETVQDMRTGWLVSSPSRFVIKANEICERGYHHAFVNNCLARARQYHLDTIAERWTRVLRAFLRHEDEPEEVRDPQEGIPTPHPVPSGLPRTRVGLPRSI
jgi:glycosyltransferase involved in cell wall biosynthesis